MAQAMFSSLYTHGYRSLTVGRARQTAAGFVSKSESGGRSIDRVNLEQERKKIITTLTQQEPLSQY